MDNIFTYASQVLPNPPALNFAGERRVPPVPALTKPAKCRDAATLRGLHGPHGGPNCGGRLINSESSAPRIALIASWLCGVVAAAALAMALSLGLVAPAAHAQSCGNNNPNCIVPTRPLGDNSGSAASTAFVQNALTANGTSCPSNLQPFAPFANTASAPTGVTLNIWDGTQCVPWATLNQSAHTLTFTGNTGSTLAQALNITQTPSGTQSGSFNMNSITVTSSAALTGSSAFLQGLNMDCSAQTTSVQGGINCLQVFTGLNSVTNASNANHNYVAIVGGGQANSGDGGTNTGAGAQGAIFGSNFIGNAVSGATNLLGVSAGEVDCSLQTGSSAKLKMCWSIVSTSLDAVHGASVDAGLTIGAESGSSGFNNGLRFTTANGIFPVPSGGTLIASDSGSVTNGIDFSSPTFSGNPFKSTGFAVSGTGVVTLGTTGSASGEILMNGSTSGNLALIAGATATNLTITQPITIGIAGSTAGEVAIAGSSSGAVGLTATSTGSGVISTGDVFTNNASFLLRTQTTLSNAAASNTATLTNAPTSGNPTKWFAIDDNGTTRHVPAW